MKKCLITGSSGLVGSECVRQLSNQYDEIHGIDNNSRFTFFGKDGDTSASLQRNKTITNYIHHNIDIRDRPALAGVFKNKFNAVIHCASQPSHDLSNQNPYIDFDINVGGTLNLLELSKDSIFVFMSTTKVYGDVPNTFDIVEHPTRFDYGSFYKAGIDEGCSIDHSTHSIFGASKLAADVLVQEYGRKFGMPTVCFRAGCITGANHAGTEMHGFISYLSKCHKNNIVYNIYGYKGKQVRDQLHVSDMVEAIRLFIEKPKTAEIYNIGGGRANAISILEAIDMVGLKQYRHVDTPRHGDQMVNIHNNSKFINDYGWSVKVPLKEIINEQLYK